MPAVPVVVCGGLAVAAVPVVVVATDVNVDIAWELTDQVMWT